MLQKADTVANEAQKFLLILWQINYEDVLLQRSQCSRSLFGVT